MRPVEERIASSKVFERAKKRIVAGHEEVNRAQEALAAAQARLQAEELGFGAGCKSPKGWDVHVVPATVPADSGHELAVTACVQELQRENSGLRSQLQSASGQGGEERDQSLPLHRVLESLVEWRHLSTMQGEALERDMDNAEELPGVAQPSVSLSNNRFFCLADDSEEFPTVKAEIVVEPRSRL